MFIMEKRDKSRKLDMSDPQPPFLECTYDDIAQYYFRHNPDGTGTSEFGHGIVATQNDIRDWYASRGWYWREKTW